MRRLLSLFLVLVALVGFVTACGDDDDDDTAASTDDTEESADDEATDEEQQADDGGAVATFCADFNDADGGDTPIDEVQASLDRAVAAQAEATTQEGSDALQALIDFTQYVLDNDDGDGVITDAEAQAAAQEFPTIEDALQVVSEACAPSRYNDGSAL